MVARPRISPHPNDGCDEDKCYEVMMAERTILITARRDSEDNLIKTIIQLSSALIVLMAGFITQSKVDIIGLPKTLFSFSIISLTLAILCGLAEQFFSSKAYQEQQRTLEDFYGKYISEFADAPSNKNVRRSQVAAFALFVASLLSLSTFAIFEAGAKRNAEQHPATATAATAAATTATAAATAATAAAAATATAAAATAAAAAAAAAAASDQPLHGQSSGLRHKIGSPDNATATSQKGRIESH